MELIKQGAEAKLFRDKNKIIKERVSKEYRLKHIDESLRKFRTRREAKVLRRLEEMQFPAPKLHDFSDKRMSITMDFVTGETVKDILLDERQKDNFQRLAEDIGKNIAMLHHKDIIHGDLTTSNMIAMDAMSKVNFIDFGLAKFTDKVEDKAVDLFLLERSIASTHFDQPDLFFNIVSQYKKEFPAEAEKVLERLEAVKKRGRHKNK